MDYLFRNTYTSSDGIQIGYWHKPRDWFPRYSSPITQIGIHCETTADLVVYRESWFDRTAKRLNYSKELQTGDADFDKGFYIHAHIPEASKAFLSNAANRQAISSLFNLGFKFVKIRKGVAIAHHRWGQDLKKTIKRRAILDQAASAMLCLAENNPKSRNPAKDEDDKRKLRREGRFHASAFAVLFLVTVIAVVTNWNQNLNNELLDWKTLFRESLKNSLPVFFGILLIGARVLRGRSWSHKQLLAYSLILFGVTTFSGYVGLRYANSKYDESPAVIEERLVLSRHASYSIRTRDRFTVQHQSIIQSKKGLRETEIPRSHYARAIPYQSYIVLVLRKGRYGFPWIEKTGIKPTFERPKDPIQQYLELKRYFDDSQTAWPRER